MNDAPRKILRELVARHGPSLAEAPRRCEGLLRDYCGAHRREVSVLVMAVEERAASDMLAPPGGTPREVLLARLTERLCDHLAVAEHAARWAVDSWALALGLISDEELAAVEQRRATQSEATATVAPQSQDETRETNPGRQTNPSQQTNSDNAVVIVVSAKGGGDYASIGEALKRAARGARLVVRPGVYDEGLVIDKEVEIAGDGHVEDIIVRSSSSSCVVISAERATVRGLTLRGRAGAGGVAFFAVDVSRGELTLEDCDITSDSLSCVAVHGPNANAVIRRCKIHDGADSGVYVFDGAAGTIEECEVYGNENVGVAITTRAKPLISKCRIHDGKNAGVVVWDEGGGEIVDCDIYGNAQAGVGVSEGGDPVVRRCRIYGGDNSGVFVHQQGRGRIEDCDIHGHREAEVAITHGGDLLLARCRIHDGKKSGVFIRDEGQGLLLECDIHGNGHSGVVVHPRGVAVLRRCNVNRNGQTAIKVYESGGVSAKDCDLTGNVFGAWDAEDGARTERHGNRG